MKPFLSLLAVLALTLLPHVANAAGAAIVAMNAQTAAGNGASLVTTNASPEELGGDRYSFQYVASAAGVYVVIESSLNGGTSYSELHVFGSHGLNETWSTPVCGGAGVCRFRTRKTATTTGTASVFVNVSGTGVAGAP